MRVARYIGGLLVACAVAACSGDSDPALGDECDSLGRCPAGFVCFQADNVCVRLDGGVDATLDAGIDGGDAGDARPLPVIPDGMIVDAPVVAPDAPVLAPDAPVLAPDAPVVISDAFVPPPDAPVVIPDAFEVAPDAFEPPVSDGRILLDAISTGTELVR